MDLADQALKMAGALAVVITLLLGGMYFLKRVMGESPGHLSKSMLRLLGGLRLGQGKAIMLVEVAGEILVLGTTTRDLTLLSRVTNKDQIEQLRTTSSNPIEGLGLSTLGLWKGVSHVSTPIQDNPEPGTRPCSSI
ncbi:MAG: hypothetical protein NPIRA01_26530 [Nitrospirales bacterium]|nr:MAG: hypothetical protein NPIRA01_26530 [Nitrospirales bacterium]